jgi:PhzF family phenazine biosynthesis protein
MKNLIVYQVDSFTKEMFKGNPAGVVLNADGLDDRRMQSIARELNNSETAFLFQPDSDECDGAIRYFTPRTEVPTCGHATIAALYALAIEKKLDSCVMRMKTRIGVLPIEITRTAGDYRVIMTQGKFELSPALDPLVVKRILSVLGIGEEDLDDQCPIQIASTGHSKVMIGIKKREKLNQLAPRYDDLAGISQDIKCNGYFVFTFDSDERDILTHGRMFAPAVGINEDPVTGNANGPLGGYLIRNGIVKAEGNRFEFNGQQGEAIGRMGVVHVTVTIEQGRVGCIQIQGDAVVVFRTTITTDLNP